MHKGRRQYQHLLCIVLSNNLHQLLVEIKKNSMHTSIQRNWPHTRLQSLKQHNQMWLDLRKPGMSRDALNYIYMCFIISGYKITKSVFLVLCFHHAWLWMEIVKYASFTSHIGVGNLSITFLYLAFFIGLAGADFSNLSVSKNLAVGPASWLDSLSLLCYPPHFSKMIVVTSSTDVPKGVSKSGGTCDCQSEAFLPLVLLRQTKEA